ncbi:MAG TPA: peptidase C39 family protein [Acidimicrobiia bacterium]|nr:peptidase C39 family protein [Acidimicrobiia bacterium]
MRLPLIVVGALALAALPAGGAGAGPGYRTSQFLWRAGHGLETWAAGPGTTRTADGRLALDPAAAQPAGDAAGAYHGRSFYNGGAYVWGEATSPMTEAGFGVTRAVPSWNADTPPGSWIEVSLRARLAGGRLTKWYSAGVWAADGSTVARHSVDGQKDSDADLATDTLVIPDGSPAAEALQVRVRFMSARTGAGPSLRLAAVALSTAPPRPAPVIAGDPARWNRTLDVPACTQSYPDGGEGWCSPTSTSMIVGYWARDPGPCEPRVRAAVDGVYDWIYDGHGNWPFNTAHAATRGLEAWVTRFRSLADAEPWIAAGIPVGVSYSWEPGTLTGAPVRRSAGHLGVLVGFDGHGDAVVNDPAAREGAVRRTYRRAEFENAWVAHSGGTAYLMYPPGWPIPW